MSISLLPVCQKQNITIFVLEEAFIKTSILAQKNDKVSIRVGTETENKFPRDPPFTEHDMEA